MVFCLQATWQKYLTRETYPVHPIDIPKQKQGDQYGSSELIGLCEPELKTQNMSYYKCVVYI